MLRTAEGALGIDDPVVAVQGAQPRAKGAWFGQVQECSVEVEIAGMKGGPESGDEPAAEDVAEDLDGQKEAAGRTDPLCVIRRQSASGHDAMHMRVETPTATVP